MGCRILNAEGGKAVLYCSTTDWAFGPLFDSEDHAMDFLEWLEKTCGDGDARKLTDKQLSANYVAWLKDRCTDEGDLKDFDVEENED